jgi:integrase/recombinase XerD
VAGYVRARHGSWFPAFRNARSTLRAFSRALESVGVDVPAWQPSRTLDARDELLREYAAYRQRYRPLAQHTLMDELRLLALFRRWFHRTRPREALRRLRPADLDGFITYMAKSAGSSQLSITATALRMFIRFLHATGKIPTDLAPHVVAPVSSIGNRASRMLSWGEVRRMLAKIDRRSPLGRRDFAVLLSMATYGMGAAEAFGLRLDDIDWVRSTLLVIRPKTRTQTLLPLLPPVGRAILAYLRRGRPRRYTGRQLFISARPPHGSIATPGVVVRHMLKKYAAAAGVTLPRPGAHLLRHTYVSRQVDAGVSPAVISDIIGHKQSTAISPYVRVATERLRSVSLPLP